MERKENSLLSRLLKILVVVAVVCFVGYFAFCFWINASGSLTNQAADLANIDQGSAVAVKQTSGRREDVFTLFIGATDEDEIRTDSMMVLVFDSGRQEANIINIPRDTLSDCDRSGAGRKINAAYASGMDEMLDEVSQVVGFRPDKYLVANFDGIAEIVDVIGGVDYDVPFNMSYHDPSQNLSIEFKKGMQHLDGDEVVEYLRWRHNDDGTGYTDGDIGRVAKLQDFLITVGTSVLSPANVTKIPDIASAVSENVKTDLATSQILWLAMQGMEMNLQENVHMETLIGDTAMINFGESLWFYVLDEEMVIDQINDKFNPFTYRLTEENFSIVTPDTYGIYSRSWLDEREVRYAGYKKAAGEIGNAADMDSGDAEEDE